MPTASNKVTNFPRPLDQVPDVDSGGSEQIAGSDPLRGLNAMISQLQEAAREARASQQIAEDERDRFATELAAERDVLRQQNFKNKEALAEMEARLNAIQEESDESARTCEEQRRQAAAGQRKLEDATRQRDAATAERDSLRKELQAARKLAEESKKAGTEGSREIAESKRTAAEASAALADAKKQLVALRQARDAASNHVSSLKQSVAQLEEQVAELTERCDSAEQKAGRKSKEDDLAETKRESDEIQMLRKEIELLNAENEARISEMTARHEAEMAKPDNAPETAPVAGGELARLQAEIAKLKPKADDFEVLTGRFERQRLETIELAAMLESAQRDIRELGASLAEARLMLKAGGGKQPAVGKAASAPTESRSRGKSGGRKILGTMRRAAQGLIENPSDAGILSELFDHSMALSGESERHGGEVLRKVADAFAALLCEAQSMPEQVNPALVRTLNQTLDFLGEALDKPAGELSGALDGARVFVIDDDAQAAEIAAASFEAVGLSAKTSMLPGEALAELASNRYDLIVLDVGLPEIDGFELCTHIRATDTNANTPILFLTGNATAENRNEATRSGGDDFVSKPFNAPELGLRGLLHVLRTRLQIA